MTTPGGGEGPIADAFVDILPRINAAEFEAQTGAAARGAADEFEAEGTTRMKGAIASFVSSAGAEFAAYDARVAESAALMSTHIGRAAKDSEGFLRGIFNVGAIAGGGFALAEVFKRALEVSQSATSETNATEQIIKNLGGTAAATADQVDKLSDSLSKNAGISPEVQRQAENLLLTAKLSPEIFGRASTAVDDLAAAMHGKADAAAHQLGLALQNPLIAARSLRTANIALTTAQQDNIKSLVAQGNTQQAQAAILDIIKSRIGGLAEASRTTSGELKNIAVQLQVAFGQGLTSGISSLASTLGDDKTLNGLKDLVHTIGSDFGVAVKDLIPVVATLARTFGVFAKAISPLASAIGSLTPVLDALAIGALIRMFRSTSLVGGGIAKLALGFKAAAYEMEFAALQMSEASSVAAKAGIIAETAGRGVGRLGAGLVNLAGGPLGIAVTGLTLVGLAIESNNRKTQEAIDKTKELGQTLNTVYDPTNAKNFNQVLTEQGVVLDSLQAQAQGLLDKFNKRNPDNAVPSVDLGGNIKDQLTQIGGSNIQDASGYKVLKGQLEALQTTFQQDQASSQALIDNLKVLETGFNLTGDSAQKYQKAVALASQYNVDLTQPGTAAGLIKIANAANQAGNSIDTTATKIKAAALTVTQVQKLRNEIDALGATLKNSSVDSEAFRDKSSNIATGLISQASKGATSFAQLAANLRAASSQLVNLGHATGVPIQGISQLLGAIEALPPAIGSELLPQMANLGTAAGQALLNSLIAEVQIAERVLSVALSGIEQFGSGQSSIVAGSLNVLQQRKDAKVLDTLNSLKSASAGLAAAAVPTGGGGGGGGGGSSPTVTDIRKFGLGVAKTLHDAILQGRPQVADAINSIKETIGNLTGSDKESLIGPLTSFVNAHTKKILDLAGAYDKITDSVKKTQDAIKGLTDSQKSFADSVNSTLTSGAALSNLLNAQGGTASANSGPTLAAGSSAVSALTASAIQDFLSKQLTSLTQFSGGLASLTKEGLNKDLLSQLATGGVSQLPLIQALLGANPSQFAGINAAQSQITALAKQTGQEAAFTQFNGQLKDANATLKLQLAEQKKATATLETKVNQLIKAIENIIAGQTAVLSRSATSTKHIVGASGGR